MCVRVCVCVCVHVCEHACVGMFGCDWSHLITQNQLEGMAAYVNQKVVSMLSHTQTV